MKNTIQFKDGRTYFTGAVPTPRNILIKAKPFIAPEATVEKENFLYRPKKISYWLNDTYGDCVTAEEAFARGCGEGAVFITDEVVEQMIFAHRLTNGTGIFNSMDCFSKTLDEMNTLGFIQDNNYYHGGKGVFGVNWEDENELKQAILMSPVKLGVAASQLEGANNIKGWIITDVEKDPSAIEDHCISVCGFGTISWLAKELEIDIPSNVDGAWQGWAIFTWNSIGIIDTQSLSAMTFEAWVRGSINKTEALYPSKEYPEWSIDGTYEKGSRVWWLNKIWELFDDDPNNFVPTTTAGSRNWKEISTTNP